jgi:hypothetical protein
VATNLGYAWPRLTVSNPTVTLSTNGRTSATNIQHTSTPGNKITYTNAAKKFGGAAQFAVSGGVGGILPGPVTVYAIAVPGPGAPPCKHSAFGTPGPFNAACVAALLKAEINSYAVAGGSVGNFASTAGGAVPAPNVGPGWFGPGGTKIGFLQVATAMTPISNQASSYGYPWTTGMLTISATLAAGAPEIFMITGMDDRNANGEGSINLVAGALSQRNFTGDNANRAWLRLELKPINTSPALSPISQLAMVALMVLVGGYVMRRRFAARGASAA